MNLVLVAAVLAAQAADPATAETEMLGVDAPDEFEVGYQARNETSAIIELVEPPEKVESWSKLITLQLMYNAAKSPGLDAFYTRWREAMSQSCAGMTDALVRGAVDGMPAIKGSLSCPKNPQTGKPENLAAVLVQGQANLMMIQVAFRRPISPSDAALIDRIVGSLKVCDQRTFSSCSARKATGFVPTN